MQLTYAAVVLGSLAALASAATKREFQFPDSVPLHRRQPSGPEYQCHANCGYTILNADEEGYCDSDEWKKLLADCLKCANQYDMWGDYGDGVKGVAKACGIDAEPEGASGGSATGTSAAAATTTVATSVRTSAAETSADESSAEETTAAAETTSATPASSTAAEETAAEETAATTVESTADANTTPGAAPTTTDNDNAASNFALSGVLAIGAALVAAAGLI
ncbi:hypothetical protein ACHAPT_003987 [Fusarium lateritium]